MDVQTHLFIHPKHTGDGARHEDPSSLYSWLCFGGGRTEQSALIRCVKIGQLSQKAQVREWSCPGGCSPAVWVGGLYEARPHSPREPSLHLVLRALVFHVRPQTRRHIILSRMANSSQFPVPVSCQASRGKAWYTAHSCRRPSPEDEAQHVQWPRVRVGQLPHPGVDTGPQSITSGPWSLGWMHSIHTCDQPPDS